MSEGGVSVARLDRSGGKRFQTLRRELGVSSFGINLIALAPGERGRIHSHERQEERAGARPPAPGGVAPREPPERLAAKFFPSPLPNLSIGSALRVVGGVCAESAVSLNGAYRRCGVGYT